jgi:hypothetical protein
MRSKILLIVFILICLSAGAQQLDDKAPSVQQALEIIATRDGESTDYSDIVYWLNEYSAHPLNLNIATSAELSRLHLLTPLQIDNLIHYKKVHGTFISIYELQEVDGLDIQTIKSILPFVAVQESITEQYKEQSQLVVTSGRTLERTIGYDYPNLKRRYLGTPEALQIRYDGYSDKGLSYGILADKDAGEQLFGGSQRQGFDFYSAHLIYNGHGLLKTLALGDYQLQFGQGLVMWSSFVFGKTPNVLAMARLPYGVTGSHSANMGTLLSGAAAVIGNDKWQCTFFGSYKKLDASAGDTLTNNQEGFSSILVSGYHRDSSELANKGRVTEQLAGMSIDYTNDLFQYGITLLSGRYSPTPEYPAQLYQTTMQKAQFFNGSLHYQYAWRSYYLFGEAASDGSHTAFVQGLLASLNSKLDAGLLYRHYDVNYFAPYAQGFSESGYTNNEQGTYLAMSYRPSATWKIEGYADLFRFPWLRYRVDAPSTGQDYLLNATWQPGKNTSCIVRYQWQQKETDVTAENTNEVLPDYLQRVRLELKCKVQTALTFWTRAEISRYTVSTTTENGFLAFQQFSYYFKKIGFTLSARYTYFDVSGYDARTYAYEDNAGYAFSIPSFQGQGYRWYILGEYKIGKQLQFNFRIAQTNYLDRNYAGSGLDKINAPHKTDAVMQLIWKI